MQNIQITLKNYFGKKRYYVSKNTMSEQHQEIYLTDKETDVITCLMSGLRPKEIAWQLTASLNTVNTHLANIKIKLGCVSIFQLGMVLGEITANKTLLFPNSA